MYPKNSNRLLENLINAIPTDDLNCKIIWQKKCTGKKPYLNCRLRMVTYQRCSNGYIEKPLISPDLLLNGPVLRSHFMCKRWSYCFMPGDCLQRNVCLIMKEKVLDC